MVDLIPKDLQKARADAEEIKTAADQMVQTFRTEFRQDPAFLDRKLPALLPQ